MHLLLHSFGGIFISLCTCINIKVTLKGTCKQTLISNVISYLLFPGDHGDVIFRLSNHLTTSNLKKAFIMKAHKGFF